MTKKTHKLNQILKDFKDEVLTITEIKSEEKKISMVIANDLVYPKKMSKLKKELGDRAELLMLSDLWQAFFDNKFQLIESIITSEVVYDTGLIKIIRDSLALRIGVQEKLQNYLISMVLFGSWARGRAVKGSDLDIVFVIDDTDVKKKTRVEIRDQLRKIVLGIAANISKDFNIQVYLLTQFWEWIRDANPVVFTLLRDGVPIYDKGLFSPWKLLLKMGKIKPTPEAIESFMASSKLLLNVVNNT
ncbi:MAG TPA: hypothetical protein ENN30_01725, partial [Candidatus Woesearchaeota archaeon]|nr:hypothetical protein [Candidatus Woesearchaeota archaeon]